MARISRRMAELLNLDGVVERPGTQRLAAALPAASRPPAHPATAPSAPSHPATAPSAPAHPPTAPATRASTTPAPGVPPRVTDENRVADVLRKQAEQRERERARRVRMGLPETPPEPKSRTGRTLAITGVALVLATGVVIGLANLPHGGGNSANDSAGSAPITQTPGTASPSGADLTQVIGDWQGALSRNTSHSAGNESFPLGSVEITFHDGTSSGGTAKVVYEFDSGQTTCEVDYQTQDLKGNDVQLYSGKITDLKGGLCANTNADTDVSLDRFGDMQYQSNLLDYLTTGLLHKGTP
jgi:hypothetical protein